MHVYIGLIIAAIPIVLLLLRIVDKHMDEKRGR